MCSRFASLVAVASIVGVGSVVDGGSVEAGESMVVGFLVVRVGKPRGLMVFLVAVDRDGEGTERKSSFLILFNVVFYIILISCIE